MSNPLARPEDLQRLLKANETYYSKMKLQMRRAHAFYKKEIELDVQLPDGLSTHRSSTATLVVDQLRDQIDTSKPNVVAQRAGGSKRAGRVANKQEMWGRQVLDNIAEEGLVAPFNQAKTDEFLRGAAALKFFPKQEVLRQIAAGESNDPDIFPFTVTAIDALMLYPSPGRGALKYMIEVEDRRVMDIWSSYPGWSDPKAKKLSKTQRENPLREVKWVEYWSWVPDPDTGEYSGSYIVEADKERIIDLPNMLMRVPYTYRYSGMGRVNHDGDPSELAVNILGLMDGELLEEIKVKTAMSAQWQFHVFSVLMVKGVSAQDAAKMLRTGPGAVMEVPLQGDVEWLEREAPNPQMLEFLREVKQNMAQKVSPSLAGGNTAEFGIHEALNIGQALKVTQGPRSSLNYMGAQLLEGLAGYMDLFDIRMNVHGRMDGVEEDRTVSGKDFKHRRFEVEFEATDPSENDRRMLALLAVERVPGQMSKETFAKVALKDIIDDWDDEQERILAEQTMERLVAAGLFDQAVVQELGLLRQEANVEEAEGEAQNRARAAVGGAAAEVAGRERNIEGLAGVAPLGESRAAAGQGLNNAEV